jgi:anti-anti-sigma factor
MRLIKDGLALPDAGLELVVTRGPAGCAEVSASGELDLFTGPELRRILGELIASGRTMITLDLTELTFIDSVGLRHVTTAADLAEDLGGALTLSGCSPTVHRFLALVARSQLRTTAGAIATPTSMNPLVSLRTIA